MIKHKKLSSLAFVDVDDRIVADVLCIRCGRNLSGLHVADRCPDCLHPASDSVHGDYLIHSDRDMVRGLSDAARLVEYGLVVLGGLMGIAIIAALASADSLTGLVEPIYNVIFAAAVISPVVATLGLVTLTTRHTAAYFWVRYGNPRSLLRLGLAAALGLTVFTVCAAYFGRVALYVGLVLWFVIPVGAFLRGVERLMRRVPNNQLATYARAMFVGLIAFGVVSTVIIFIRHQAATDASWQDSQLAFTAINCLCGIALAIAGYMLIVRVRRTLSSIAA